LTKTKGPGEKGEKLLYLKRKTGNGKKKGPGQNHKVCQLDRG